MQQESAARTSKRERAKLFASKIPRPRPRQTVENSSPSRRKGEANFSSSSARDRHVDRPFDNSTSFDDLALLSGGAAGASPSKRGGVQSTSKLDALEMRHDKARDEVDRIRQELGMG